MSTAHVMGIDVGSTYVKGIVVDDGGAQVAITRIDTPWRAQPNGCTEMLAADLRAAVGTILRDLAAQLTARAVDARVVAVGVSGMAEAGVLVDADGQVVRPIVAWFDPRGEDALTSVSAEVARDFPGRTGLPFTPLATFAKLAMFRAEGLDLAGLQWLDVPEYVAHVLGGDRRAEMSLVARTGLLDQDTGEPWDAALAELGVDRSFLPPIAAAGSSWGSVGADLPEPFTEAAITVAGHDHLVASVAAGALTPDRLYDSMGTAEALVRLLDHPLAADSRDRLAAHGINTVRHMLPGRAVLLAGTRSGLLMRRVLQLAGISDAEGRARLDDAVMALDDVPAGLTVSGADNTDGILAVHAATDGLSPAAVFAATLRHGTEVLHEVLAHMDAEVPPATSTIVAGGWAQMRCVRRDRRDALPVVTFSGHQEDTAFGAALVAAYCADDSATDLIDFAAGFSAITPTPEGSSA
jgi:sugar (pentulose or hexulose) kinase